MTAQMARASGRFAIAVGLLVSAGAGAAQGQGHGGGGGGGHTSSAHGPHTGHGPSPGSGGPGPIPVMGGGNGGRGPIILGVGGVFLPTFIPIPVPVVAPPAGGGLMLPAPAVPAAGWMPPARAKVRAEPTKSDNYVTLGDNLFKAGNNHRAEQRYLQAIQANPHSAKPRVRLAQLALVRGDYGDAAEQFRAAMAAEPGWLVNATDVQALFAEPGDFARALAKLESHLQASPTDRDGWLVLGAEWYLSGRTRQAADVFTRLNDRKPDATLATFLDATAPDPAPREPR
jgi:tetratricopeptide (TPR) repeat protein